MTPALSAVTSKLPWMKPARSGRPSVLVKRGYVCDYEVGERPLPDPGTVLRLGRYGLLPLTTVACVATGERVVGLTYDDGPDPQYTEPILDALAKHDQRATFFVMVSAAEARPDLVRRIIAEGHEVALHGIDHTRLKEMPLRQAVSLVREAKARLERITGQPATLFRPTYGAQNIPLLLAVRALGMDVVVWTSWARDWELEPAEVIAERAAGSLHHGGFMLLHDAAGDGVGQDGPLDRGRATQLLLDQMDEKGYRSRTVSDLLAQYPAVRTVWT